MFLISFKQFSKMKFVLFLAVLERKKKTNKSKEILKFYTRICVSMTYPHCHFFDRSMYFVKFAHFSVNNFEVHALSEDLFCLVQWTLSLAYSIPAHVEEHDLEILILSTFTFILAFIYVINVFSSHLSLCIHRPCKTVTHHLYYKSYAT